MNLAFLNLAGLVRAAHYGAEGFQMQRRPQHTGDEAFVYGRRFESSTVD